jgi:hypothetical protein
MYEDYDDYYEPTLAEEIFEEAKEKLEKALKKEFAEKIQKAEKVLSEQGKRYIDIENKEVKLISRERELERKFKDIENEFKKEKISKFIKDLQEYLGQTYYKIKEKDIPKAKCGACDDKRKIEVKMPDGTMRKIDCSCNERIYFYTVEEVPIFNITTYKKDKEIVIYLNYLAWDERLENISPEKIYNKFEDVKKANDRYHSLYSVFYTSKEEAQKHADYLNELKRL